MRKLENLRRLGHHVILLMGDFTAKIGDPSGKLEARGSARKVLSDEEIQKNLSGYKEQVKNILSFDDPVNPVDIKYNSEWLSKMSFADVLDLATHFTVQQMIKRDMFQKRLEEEKPIYINEFMYPMMQGYDSVAMDIDIELGGNDQLFNMMAGRQLMQDLKGKEKFVIAGKLLVTPDGKKMGKSEGNMIKLTDTAEDIYGKIMAFPDEGLVRAFELLLDTELEEISEFEKRLKNGENPMILKKELAFRLVKDLRGEEEAKQAQQFFEQAFQKKNFDINNIPEASISKTDTILTILVDKTAIAPSKSAGRRLLKQNAVKFEGKTITDEQQRFTQSGILKCGKKFFKLNLKD